MSMEEKVLGEYVKLKRGKGVEDVYKGTIKTLHHGLFPLVN